MRHNYRRMLAYNPVKKEVTQYKPLGEDFIFRDKWYDEIFFTLWNNSNHTTEVILGISLNGDLYQLSPAAYGGYVKEDIYSAQTISKGAVLAAIATYKKNHNMKFDED